MHPIFIGLPVAFYEYPHGSSVTRWWGQTSRFSYHWSTTENEIRIAIAEDLALLNGIK